jgi:hypothetical protein
MATLLSDHNIKSEVCVAIEGVSNRYGVLAATRDWAALLSTRG